MTDLELTAANVQSVIRECLYRDEEIRDGQIPDGCIRAEGVVLSAGFHPGRLESNRKAVADMLSQLPDSFQEGRGGGMSFLNAYQRQDGQQWGEHRDMDALFTLGIALGLVRECMPGMREILPGGVPYYAIIISGQDDNARCANTGQ